MKYYFKKFASQKINTELDPYVWLLYLSYCSLIEIERNGGEFWENLKIRIKEFNFQKRTAAKIKTASSFILRTVSPISISAATSSPTSIIKSIQIKNFRGFGSEFNGDDKGTLIDFDLNNTIFYGPNGSGKSSLCDALEYMLTGQVREANRRNRRVNEYIKRIGSSESPSIKLSFVEDSKDSEKFSEDEKRYYSQAFIEKNRIQEFSLFGSKDTGIKKEEILSILIGMDELSNLAKVFVQTTAFRSNLTAFKRNVVQKKIEKLNTTNSSNLALKNSYEETISTEGVKAENILQSLSDNLRKYDDLNSRLVKAKTELSYSKLYEAIQELHTTVIDKCPACDTPLDKVTINPFNKANDELIKLQGIRKLEEECETQKTIVVKDLNSLETIHDNLVTNTTQSNALKETIPKESVLHTKSPTYSIKTRSIIDDNIAGIKEQIKTIDDYFNEVKSLAQKQEQKQERVEENNKIITVQNERKSTIITIKNNWQTAQTNLDSINLALGTYTTDLVKLNNEKVLEDKYNNFVDSLINIYPKYYDSLQLFKDAEFQTRFGNLESEIAGFYTQINKHDAEHEIVESFKINNSSSDYKIEFKVKGSTLYEDASIKFSEGHLRSLGLSILLANAKINSLPFIIFDDVVNAIDSDHRANIIEMMVNDVYLKSVQQIVSTHDRLYWERFSIENKKGKYCSYILKCTTQGIVHYHYNLSFNDKIQHALDHFDIRQALLYCRIWFETLAKQFCIENNIELTGTLRKNEYQVSIEPSLGSIYRVLESKLTGNANLMVLKRDEINYKGINQEHHSFDEYNFNFIHSRTSREVQNIFDSVKGLDADIKLIKNHEAILNELLIDYKYCEERLKTLNPKMPMSIQTEIIQKRDEAIKLLIELPIRMKNLNVDDALIKVAKDKIRNKIVVQILAIISRNKGMT